MTRIVAIVKTINNLPQACKVVREYTSMPVGEIKSKIEKGEILLEYDYLDLDELKLLKVILNRLVNLGANVTLYRGSRELDLAFLENTIASYESIEKEREEEGALMFEKD